MKPRSETMESEVLGSVDPEDLDVVGGDARWSLDSLASSQNLSPTHGKYFDSALEIPRRLKHQDSQTIDDEIRVQGEGDGRDYDESSGRGTPASPPQWVRDLLFFAALLLMIGTFRSAVADWNQVPTGSMKPSILEGDRIFVNKLAFDLRVPFTGTCLYHWAEPERGDIIVFFSPKDGTRLVKRVVGIPGDKVELQGNTLIINGQAARYLPTSTELLGEARREHIPMDSLAMEAVGEHVYPVMKRRGRGSRLSTIDPIVVPEGHIFAMGDNRDNSADSRVFGMVPMTLIVGKATNVVLSWRPESWGSLRWERVFSALP